MPGTLRCIVVTPEQTALEQEADFVALPLFDGEIGIAPNHSPMIGRLGYGAMRLKLGSDEKLLYVDGGFVEVADNVVSVLTNRAIPPARIDTAAAEMQLASALRQAAPTKELQEIRERQVAQSRAQLRAARQR